MLFADRLTLDAPRRTKDGYMAVRARSARTGVYQYTGREIDPDNKHGLRDKAMVNVLRDDKTVFDKSAVQSFIGKPITDDHPAEAVTADNWRDHARGTIMGAMRDGEYLAFDLMLTDKATIEQVGRGKRELSNGYGAELEFGTFTAQDGTLCDARQSKITGGNHIALVRYGRAGADCRISDAATCQAMSEDFLDAWLADQRTYTDENGKDKNDPTRREAGGPGGEGDLTQDGDFSMKTLTIDGLKVPNVSDEAEAAILKLQADMATSATALTKAQTDLADANKALETEKGKVTALEAQVKDAADPAKLEKLVADRADLVAKAKVVSPKVVTDGKTDAEIRRAVVEAALGDGAKDMSDDAVAGAFAIATKDAKPEQADQLRDALSKGVRATVNDNASVRDLARASQY